MHMFIGVYICVWYMLMHTCNWCTTAIIFYVTWSLNSILLKAYFIYTQNNTDFVYRLTLFVRKFIHKEVAMSSFEWPPIKSIFLWISWLNIMQSLTRVTCCCNSVRCLLQLVKCGSRFVFLKICSKYLSIFLYSK